MLWLVDIALSKESNKFLLIQWHSKGKKTEQKFDVIINCYLCLSVCAFLCLSVCLPVFSFVAVCLPVVLQGFCFSDLHEREKAFVHYKCRQVSWIAFVNMPRFAASDLICRPLILLKQKYVCMSACSAFQLVMEWVLPFSPNFKTNFTRLTLYDPCS